MRAAISFRTRFQRSRSGVANI